MKHDNKNEMDLLLRSFAKGGRGKAPSDIGNGTGREDGALSDHLDADELSLFAEGVVPAPARARFVAHLADCGTCRATVINLTSAAGLAAQSETLKTHTEPGFWQKLTSLFSLPVLRYGVPALALTAVIAVSFLALRSQRRPDLVAQNGQITYPAANATPINRRQSDANEPRASTDIPSNTPSGTDTRARVVSSEDKKTTQNEISKAAEPPMKTADLDAPTAPLAKDAVASKQGYVAGGASRPVYAPETQAAPPPPPKPSAAGGDKTDALQKEEVARRETRDLTQEAEKNQPRDEDRRQGPSRSNNATLSAPKRADGLMTERGEAKPKSRKAGDYEAETRTVAGKRFRREGNVWVDTAYDSSRATINVSRGSEQFRALTSDEPGIRTIAEKLSGVVIVVWNGRAYRIR